MGGEEQYMKTAGEEGNSKLLEFFSLFENCGKSFGTSLLGMCFVGSFQSSILTDDYVDAVANETFPLCVLHLRSDKNQETRHIRLISAALAVIRVSAWMDKFIDAVGVS